MANTDCVWDPLHTDPSITISNSGHNAQVQGLYSTVGDIIHNTGKWYYEIKVVSIVAGAAVLIGWATNALNIHTILGADSHGWGVYPAALHMIHSNIETAFGSLAVVAGDVMGVEVDCDAGTVGVYVNDALSGVYSDATMIGLDLRPSVSDASSGAEAIVYEMRAGHPSGIAFSYPNRAGGYLPWNGAVPSGGSFLPLL